MNKEDNRGRLVIGVKQGETVFVGDDIEVTVTEIANKVSLAFLAPKTTTIRRSAIKELDDNGQRYAGFHSTRRRN